MLYAYFFKGYELTALLNVQSDILSALDGGSIAAVVLVDVSAAFDTIGHNYNSRSSGKHVIHHRRRTQLGEVLPVEVLPV